MNDDKPFRIQPRRPRGRQSDDIRILSSGYKRLMHVVRMSRRKTARGATSSRKANSFKQRCVIRVSYSGNKMPGQWAAHGRYIMRDSASQGKKAFDSESDRINASEKFKTWQNAGDPRLFKIIVSPEFGERLDLEEFTLDLMHNVERDLGSIEWIAVEHHNTGHPHVHIALRGTSGNNELRIPRQYIKTGIRDHAQSLCTRKLGYRTAEDALEAQTREVREMRFTSLDRIIDSPRPKNAARAFIFASKPGIAQNHPLVRRLNHLKEMQLAEDLGAGIWKIRSDFGSILKAMQRAGDRQRMLADHGRLLSDPRLAQEFLQPTGSFAACGRVLVHGLDEDNGRPYMLLETTEGELMYISHDWIIEEARHSGKLRPNAFIEIQRDPKGKTTVLDRGDAETLLSDIDYLHKAAQGAVSEGPTWTGWLGRWQAAVSRQAGQIPRQPRESHHQRE